MKPSQRVLILLILFEACLGALWMWLMNGITSGSMHLATSKAEAASTIGSVLGGAMGFILVMLVVICLVLRKREREQ